MSWFFGGKKASAQAEGKVDLSVVDPRELDGHCLITGNLQIRGDVYFSGQLRVDGRIDGKVSIFEGGKGLLIVSKGGVVNGPVVATSVLADGTVNGPMDVAEKLECRPNAVIRGKVLYGSIHISDGARIEAQCKQRDQAGLGGAEDIESGTLSLATRDVSLKR